MYALALAVVAVLLIALAPRVMARQTRFRQAPRAALIAWQAVAFAGVLSALAATPIAVLELTPHGAARPAADLIAVAVSGFVLASLLLNAHLIGTRLRVARRRHRELLDLVGRDTSTAQGKALYRVVPHETPTAYCIPGLRGHVVLTDGTLSSLREDELAAVLAHERAHLDQRHDLVLEFFSVLHSAAPPPIRAPQALSEVKLLIEVLADRAARRTVGDVPLARALLALVDGVTPVATLGAGGPDPEPTALRGRRGSVAAPVPVNPTLVRMRLLAQPAAPRWLAVLVYSFAAGVLAAPIALVGLALGS